MSDELEQQDGQHIARIDRTIHEAGPVPPQLAQIRTEAVAKVDAYTLRRARIGSGQAMRAKPSAA
jgi:hypothetical protein